MNMNWEFLLGLLLPAYGVGYIWLIRTARDDPAMYAEIEKHLSKLLWAFVFALLVTGLLIGLVNDLTPQFKKDAWSASAVLILLISIVQQSFPFFRRIAALPPKTAEMAAQATRHTEVPTEATK